MRAYFFGNMYLSSIQQGLQSAHAVAEMFVKYPNPNLGDEYYILDEWARKHKTIVLLNAGYGSEILSLVEFFQRSDKPFPWASFYEEQASLTGAITTVGIIVPEEIYNAAKNFREGVKGNPTELLNKAIVGDFTGLDPWNGYKPSIWEQELAQRLNFYQLAR